MQDEETKDLEKHPSKNTLENILYRGLFFYLAITLIGLLLYPFFCLTRWEIGYTNFFNALQQVIRVLHDFWRFSVVAVLLMFYRPIYKAIMELHKWWAPRQPPEKEKPVPGEVQEKEYKTKPIAK